MMEKWVRAISRYLQAENWECCMQRAFAEGGKAEN
jgi:hypothetical protein